MMFDKIYQLYMLHISLIDKYKASHEQIFKALINEQISLIESSLNNRDRLLNIIESIQGTIEESLNAITIDRTPKCQEFLSITKRWQDDIGRWVDHTEILDAQIIEELNGLASSTKVEIINIFKSKNAISGYNLNNLKNI